MDYTEEQRSIITLHLIPEIGPRRFHRLVEHFGSAARALAADPREIAALEDFPLPLAQAVAGARRYDLDEELERVRQAGARILTCADDEYPEGLKHAGDGPAVIYVRGELLPRDRFSVAVVGTRHPTPYGREAARRFAADLAGASLTVVSGLARGIDTCAHEAALKAGGRTIAVLGNGLNRHYPPENRKLEDAIAERGALVSEFPMEIEPDRGNFPRRNRIIAALSLATLVVESDIKSGALITARYAAEQGKEVFAVPGPVFSRYSKGPNHLLRSGARPAQCAGDIIEDTPLLNELSEAGRRRQQDRQQELLFLSPEQRKVLDALEHACDGMPIDRLGEAAGLEPAELSALLVELELKGLVRGLAGKLFVRAR